MSRPREKLTSNFPGCPVESTLSFLDGKWKGVILHHLLTEGTLRFNSANVCADPLPANTLPLMEYATAGGRCAVTGGYRYRGPITPLDGDYIYGDYCSGTIWVAAPVGAGWSTTPWSDTGHFISGFGEDEAGELYLTDLLGGQVLRFDSAQVDGIFADGFESP